MELILIRHADPDYKRDTITELGHAQAKALARSLKNTQLDFLYVSPLGRAQATSRYVSDALHINPITLDWLKEINWVPIGSFTKDYRKNGKSATADDWWYGFDPEEEMKPDYQNITSGFDDLLRSHGYSKSGNLYRIDQPCEDVIGLLSHGGTILTLLGYLLHWSIPLIHIYTRLDATSITRLYWKKVSKRHAIPKLVTFNDSSHLSNIPSGYSCDL